ncbi:MAG: fibrobacter succinogenes major paralogous domain-containing protein [Candidatus Neomarinimicrobiota bacterium]
MKIFKQELIIDQLTPGQVAPGELDRYTHEIVKFKMMKNNLKRKLTMYYSRITMIILLSVFMGCSDNSVNSDNQSDNQIDVIGDETFENGILTDVEGNTYSTIQIGDQLWTAENWECTHSTDGNILDGVHPYDRNDTYIEEYGRLYTWEAANDACPSGWHLPSNNEWQVLINAVGSSPADKLREGGSSGLDIKLGGRRTESGSYGYVGQVGIYWTADQSDATHVTVKLFALGEINVITDNTPRAGELSVRYIKDSN